MPSLSAAFTRLLPIATSRSPVNRADNIVVTTEPNPA
jgi:hypothetical protein